jgi:hypothetical protein
MGDEGICVQLRRWVEKHYEPVHDAERGEFYFRFRLRDRFPRGQYNDLIMPAFVGSTGTWSDIFTAPNLVKFQQPTVEGIDFERLAVSQAFYGVLRRQPADARGVRHPRRPRPPRRGDELPGD